MVWVYAFPNVADVMDNLSVRHFSFVPNIRNGVGTLRSAKIKNASVARHISTHPKPAAGVRFRADIRDEALICLGVDLHLYPYAAANSARSFGG